MTPAFEMPSLAGDSVLSRVAKGASIAAQLGLVVGTVKIHVANIYSKLGVSDRTQALVAAVKRGIINID